MRLIDLVNDASKVLYLAQANTPGAFYVYKKLESENEVITYATQFNKESVFMLVFDKEKMEVINEKLKGYGFFVKKGTEFVKETSDNIYLLYGIYIGPDPDKSIAAVLDKEKWKIRGLIEERGIYQEGNVKDIDEWLLQQQITYVGLSPLQIALFTDKTVMTNFYVGKLDQEVFAISIFSNYSGINFLSAFYVNYHFRKWGIGTKFLKKTIYYAIAKELDPINITVASPVFLKMIESLSVDLQKRLILYKEKLYLDVTTLEENFFKSFEKSDVNFTVPDEPFYEAKSF